MRARWFAALFFAAAALYTAYAHVLPAQDGVTTSFAGYWAVGRELRAGTPVVDLYDDAVLADGMQRQGVPIAEKMIGPPSLALTVAPIAHLPYAQARRVWLWGLCLPALVLGLALLSRSSTAVAGGLIGAAFLVGAPAREGFAVGQVYTLFLLLHAVAAVAAARSRSAVAGVALAPMVALRGWYGLPVLAGLALVGRWRGALVGIGAAAALVVASVPIVGLDAWVYFFTVHLPEMAGNPYAAAPAYQTLRSLTLRLTTADAIWGGAPALPLPWLAAPLFVVCLAAVAVPAAIVTVRARNTPPAVAGPLVVGMWTCVELAAGPAAEDYHFVLAAVPATAALALGPPAARALVAMSLPLLLLTVEVDVPAALVGWNALLVYPRLWGVLLLAGACGVSLRALEGRHRVQETPMPPPAPVWDTRAKGMSPAHPSTAMP